MTSTTRADEVIDRLVAVISAATGVQTLDGPQMEVADEAILVRSSPTGPGYTSTLTREPGFGRPRLREDWSVSVTVSVWRGSDAVPAARRRLVSLIGLVDDAVRDSHRVDGVWQDAAIEGDLAIDQAPYRDGQVLMGTFTVQGVSLL